MSAKNGNALVKLLVVLVLVGGVAWATMRALRTTAVVVAAERTTAADIVPATVEVHADKDLQPLKIARGGRVVWSEPLDPSHLFKKGDVLLKLDTSDLDRDFAAVKRDFEFAQEQTQIRQKTDPRKVVAQHDYDEAVRLQGMGYRSDEDVKAAKRALDKVITDIALEDSAFQKKKADFEVAKQNYDEQLKKMQVVAPTDGMVVDVMVAPGALINDGATVATYYANERVVLARVGEDYYAKLKLNLPAKVRLLTLPNREFDGKITKILPFADAETRRYTVYLNVKAGLESLTPNATGEASITAAEHPNALVIPRRAVFNGNHVFVVKDGRVEKREIEIGFKALNFAEVLKGLAAGDQVIVEDLDQFRDGQHVAVEPMKS